MQHLLEEVFPLAEAKAEDGRLDFESWHYERACGTHACLFGWAVTTEPLKADGWFFSGPVGQPHCHGTDPDKPIMVRIADYYGISPLVADALFGTAGAPDELFEEYDLDPEPKLNALEELQRRRELAEAILARASAKA
jgi:hypothetical protein